MSPILIIGFNKNALSISTEYVSLHHSESSTAPSESNPSSLTIDASDKPFLEQPRISDSFSRSGPLFMETGFTGMETGFTGMETGAGVGLIGVVIRTYGEAVVILYENNSSA